MIVPEFKFWSREFNYIFRLKTYHQAWEEIVVFDDLEYEGDLNELEFKASEGVLLPIIPDLKSASGDPYTMGDVLFLANDDELYFGEEEGLKFFSYEAVKDHTKLHRHLHVMVYGECGYWPLYHPDGTYHGINSEYYPPMWIENECERWHLKDKDGNIANIFTHAEDWPSFFEKTGIKR